MVASSLHACVLCGLSTYHPITGRGGEVYCCHACREVAGLLREDPAPALLREQPGTSLASTELSLGGLWCSSCAWLVEERLKRSPGVGKAQVSFLQLQARIEYDPASTTAHKIRGRIRQLGYRAYLEGENPGDEEDAFFTRMLVGGLLAMHIMTSSILIYIRQGMGLATPDAQWLVDFFHWMEFAMSIPLAIILGFPILRAGLASLLRGLPNIHTLVTLGAFSALALSIRNLLLHAGQVYFDTAAMLLFLLTVGHWLEMQAHKSGRQAVEALASQIPDRAALVAGGKERVIPVDEIRPGMRLRVRPGERFPADGLVATGLGDVDESLLNGEPTPFLKREGDPVYAGTISLDGAFEVIVSASGAGTRAGQIGQLLHQALWQRSPVAKLADRLAATLVVVAIALAAGTYLFWNARLGQEAGLMNALAVLLIACPCALGLATPLTQWQALARAAQNGIILRSTAVLERLNEVTDVFFDKTGTLTRLPARMQEIATQRVSPEVFLRRLAAIESLSEHPLAEAIVAAARSRRLELPRAERFRALPGEGIRAQVEEKLVWAGNQRLMEKQALQLPADLSASAENWQRKGWVVVYAGWDGQVRGALALGEEPRRDALIALQELAGLGKQVAVLTGDTCQAGQRWRALLGIPVSAGLTPEEKLAHIQALGSRTAMVGDGINDGPALAAAGVGIALLRGTDVARAAAEAVLVRDELRLVPWLWGLARETRRRLHQNLVWACAYNLVGIGLAVSGHLQPVVGAVAMVVSSLLVTQNALRLRRFPALNAERGALPDGSASAALPAILEDAI